jgi:hypothetical protein
MATDYFCDEVVNLSVLDQAALTDRRDSTCE